MIDATTQEQEAVAAALKPLGEIAAEIGLTKPLGNYTRDEALTVIKGVVNAYYLHLLDGARTSATPKEGTYGYV